MNFNIDYKQILNETDIKAVAEALDLSFSYVKKHVYSQVDNPRPDVLRALFFAAKKRVSEHVAMLGVRLCLTTEEGIFQDLATHDITLKEVDNARKRYRQTLPPAKKPYIKFSDRVVGYVKHGNSLVAVTVSEIRRGEKKILNADSKYWVVLKLVIDSRRVADRKVPKRQTFKKPSTPKPEAPETVSPAPLPETVIIAVTPALVPFPKRQTTIFENVTPKPKQPAQETEAFNLPF